MLGSKSPVSLPAPAPASPTVSCLVYILLEICQSSRWGGGEIREGGWKNRFPPLGQGWRGAGWDHPASPARLAQESRSSGRNQAFDITVN